MSRFFGLKKNRTNRTNELPAIERHSKVISALGGAVSNSVLNEQPAPVIRVTRKDRRDGVIDAQAQFQIAREAVQAEAVQPVFTQQSHVRVIEPEYGLNIVDGREGA